MKPIIGILARPLVTNTGRNVFGTYDEVSNTIKKFGGIPIQLLPPENYSENLTPEKEEDLKVMVESCDGILLQGGSDFYPYDLFVAEYVYLKDIPTLGICLGMQTMGCVHNGELGHVKNKSIHQAKELNAHKIDINENSKLYRILGEQVISVNSRHQDCVVKTDLNVVATSSDGVIESVEDPNKKFYIGVQWHPESFDLKDNIMSNLFKEFIKITK